MTTKELHRKLLDAYTLRNLNIISLTLINLYKSKQFSKLRRIAEIISDSIEIEIHDNGKGFSKLIMLYHPDRIHYYINEINRLAGLDDLDGLLNHAHILKLERIEEIAASLNAFEDIDYSPVYEWDLNTEGFSVSFDTDPSSPKESRPRKQRLEYDFYDAVKLRQYGNTDVEFPPYYLEDIDEFELSSAHINDLDGVQYCIHARVMDLSNNKISDIRPLVGLSYLEELNISDNQIGSIDTLSNLQNLKRLFLSNNRVDDISPLLVLNKLEYVELSGNNISLGQINELQEVGVTVDL